MEAFFFPGFFFFREMFCMAAELVSHVANLFIRLTADSWFNLLIF